MNVVPISVRLALLVSLTACDWSYIPHETRPSQIADPAVEFQHLVLSGYRAPSAVRVEGHYATLVSMWAMRTRGSLGASLSFGSIKALEFRRKGRVFAIDVFDLADRRAFTFYQLDEASARRLCDVIAALHARAVAAGSTALVLPSPVVSSPVNPMAPGLTPPPQGRRR